jgi:hypothetical protein
MASILVRRDQFNITPQGIIHKPTDAYFSPHANDPFSGSIRVGRLGNEGPVGERHDPDQVKKMMMELWTEYVAANSDLFSIARPRLAGNAGSDQTRQRKGPTGRRGPHAYSACSSMVPKGLSFH